MAKKPISLRGKHKKKTTKWNGQRGAANGKYPLNGTNEINLIENAHRITVGVVVRSSFDQREFLYFNCSGGAIGTKCIVNKLPSTN